MTMKTEYYVSPHVRTVEIEVEGAFCVSGNAGGIIIEDEDGMV